MEKLDMCLKNNSRQQEKCISSRSHYYPHFDILIPIAKLNISREEVFCKEDVESLNETSSLSVIFKMDCHSELYNLQVEEVQISGKLN